MLNLDSKTLKILESFRTKEEIIEYFKQNGINITEEQIIKLKQNYENICEDKNKLTLEQLDNVAGGLKFIACETHESFTKTKNSHQADIDRHRALSFPNGKNGGIVAIFDGENNHGFTLSSAEDENSSYRENSVILSQTLAGLNKSDFDKICTDLSGNNVSTWDLQLFKSLYEVAKTMHKNGNNKTISINSNSNNSNINDIVGFLIGGLAIVGASLAVGFSSDNNKNKK